MELNKSIYLILLIFNFLSCCDRQADLYEKIKRNSPPKWMVDQISIDLHQYKNRTSLDNELSLNHPFVKIKIIKNNITVEYASGTHSKAEEIRIPTLLNNLNFLNDLVGLPAMEFYLYAGDAYYQLDSCKYCETNSHPVFAFAKNCQDKHTILLPDIAHFTYEQYNHFLVPARSGSKKYPWEKKVNIAIWRGTTTDKPAPYHYENLNLHPRFLLCKLSKEFPYLLDSFFINNEGRLRDDEVRKYFEREKYFDKHLPIEDHLNFKYQVLIDGYTTAWVRAYWQLLSNCIVFKQDSNEISWYYIALKPYEHYIPFASDCSDLIEKINWAKEHDDECEKMAKNATDFAQKNLTYTDMLYYMYLLLIEYSKI